MKFSFVICISLLMLSVSCKKSIDQPNTPPPVTDTTKPPVVQPDTSTLLKSVWYYYFDGTGTVVTDSSHEEWTYDDQRRILQQSTEATNHTESFIGSNSFHNSDSLASPYVHVQVSVRFPVI
jgi:hypothetical protein